MSNTASYVFHERPNASRVLAGGRASEIDGPELRVNHW